MAIGTTLFTQGSQTSSLPPPVDFLAEESVAELPAVIVQSSGLNRAERIASMRALINQESLLVAADQSSDVIFDLSLATTTGEASSQEDIIVVALCPNYAIYSGFWDARGLTVSVVEGGKTITRASIDSSLPPELILQLPAGTSAGGNSTCLSSDVIGIANDGSLIRNDEAALYSIFGSQIIVGYALDGFPIYGGQAPAVVDLCGGATVNGQYAYYTNGEAAGILSCFSGSPVRLP